MNSSHLVDPDIKETKRFLSLLDDQAISFSFQTFDDDADRKDRSLTRQIHSPLDECWLELVDLNRRGAGVFVTVNETNGEGRKRSDIIRIRALWVDDDGDGRRPDHCNFTVESSPGKHHYYTLVQELELDEFEQSQQWMIDTYASDPNAKDRARVLRLPGFYHLKSSVAKNQAGEPHLVRVTEATELPPLAGGRLLSLVKKTPAINMSTPEASPKLYRDLKDAMSHLDLGDHEEWIATGYALKDIGEIGFEIWHQRSSECENYKDEGDCRQQWDGFTPTRTDYRAIFAKALRLGWVNSQYDIATIQAAFRQGLGLSPQGKKTIHVSNGPLDERVRDAAQSVSELSPPIVFQRGYALVEVLHTDGPGSAKIRPLKLPGMRVLLSKTANWTRGKPDRLMQANPCDKAVSGLLESPGDWGGIPSLAGIIEVPILKANGQLITQEGYEPESKFFIKGPIPPLIVPDTPTREDAVNAASILMGVFAEFPFAFPELDRSVLLAYMLTLAIRHEIPTAPMTGIDASTPGSGKNLIVECANLIVRGAKPSIMPPLKGMGAEEETRKRITSVLSQGDSSVLLDNWTTAVGGESMNVLMTTETWSDRLLGKSEAVKLPSRVTWAATGNNLIFRGDMTRRSLVLRLEPKVEKPELTQFKVSDLIGYTLKNRAQLLSALFTILKAYQLAGLPTAGGPPLGSFEGWHRRVVDCLLWIGYQNPIDSQERLRDVDPDLTRHVELLSMLDEVYEERPFKVSDLGQMSFVVQGAQANLRKMLQETVPSGVHDIDRQRLGKLLSQYLDRIAGNLVLRKVDRSGKSKASLSYFVERIRPAQGIAPPPNRGKHA